MAIKYSKYTLLQEPLELPNPVIKEVKPPLEPVKVESQVVPNPSPTPQTYTPAISDPTKASDLPPVLVDQPTLDQDRVEWTPRQVKLLKAIIDGSIWTVPKELLFDFPELAQFGTSGGNLLEKGFNTIITLGRGVYKTSLSIGRLANFLQYQSYTSKEKNLLGSKSLGNEEDRAGFNLANIKLALPENKEKDSNRPTASEVVKNINTLTRTEKELIGKVERAVKAMNKLRPTLMLEIHSFFLNSSYNTTVTVPFYFMDMEYSVESTLSPINVLGRNLKRYHYAGSEDSLEFKLILKKGYKIESPIEVAKSIAMMAKANPEGEYPIITLGFSSSENAAKFFPFKSGKYYILTKAPFKPTRFKAKDVSEFRTQDGPFKRVDFYDPDTLTRIAQSPDEVNPEPTYIEQSLYLKRIADNPHDLYN